MEIRCATETDARAVAALETVCFPHDAWSETALFSYIQDTDCPTYVLLSDAGEVCGYVTGRMIPPEAELYRICMHPDKRGMGYAGRLIAAFHTHLSAGGCETCYLEVRASNTAARALYCRHGYEEIGVRKNYYRAPSEDAVIYEKKIKD